MYILVRGCLAGTWVGSPRRRRGKSKYSLVCRAASPARGWGAHVGGEVRVCAGLPRRHDLLFSGRWRQANDWTWYLVCAWLLSGKVFEIH